MKTEFEKLIQELKKMKAEEQLKSYISYIRFPFFRNLEKNTKIDFDFPLTVFVGQNGSGKTSTLHALYGAPENKSMGKYWFSTKIDTIEESADGFKPSMIYSWENDKHDNNLEVLKIRSGLKKGVDYWEPSIPRKKYGMKLIKPKPGEKDRNPPIKKNVLHLDFRSILSAFDKYFYFDEPKNLKTSKTKQDFLRRKSVNLNNIIVKHEIQKNPKGKPINDKPKKILKNELAIISEILGRQYKNGLIINHKFFNKWGLSILFETNSLKYSEAFAGSGEMSAAILVHEVMNAPEHSLILLDEPEVSLHPGAQKKLVHFLLEEIKKKKHQIVLSTHSPGIVDKLPKKAIKVFNMLPTGYIQVLNESSPREAFYFIGQDNPNQIILKTEDKLSAAILDSVATKKGNSFRSLFDIKALPVGAETMKKYASTYSEENLTQKFLLFDGDKNPNSTFNPEEELTNTNRTESFLSSKIQLLTNINPKRLFSISGMKSAKKCETFEKFLQYWHTNVFFLPKLIPEELIWNDDVAKNILGGDQAALKSIDDTLDYKDKFKILADHWGAKPVTSDIIFTLQQRFIKKWCENPNKDYQTIETILNTIKEKVDKDGS